MAGEKILSVDDSPTVQRLIDMILSSQGYQVVLASDGAIALTNSSISCIVSSISPGFKCVT